MQFYQENLRKIKKKDGVKPSFLFHYSPGLMGMTLPIFQVLTTRR